MIGDAAKLIDFGSATGPTTLGELPEALKPASRAVLAAATQGRDKSYRPEGNLASLLNVFMIHLGDFEIGHEDKDIGLFILYRT